MDGDYYLKKLSEINTQLSFLIGELAQEEYAKEQFIKLVPPEERIIPFPTAKTTKEKNENEIIPDFLEFSDKELQKMPKEFNTLFKKGKIKARVRRREDGRYEIRCQFNNIKISASSKKNLETAKQKFIEKISKPQQYTQKKPRKSLLFGTYLLKWLETVKKPYVKENTYKSYLQTVNFDILPVFGKKEIKKITSFDIQEHINNYNAQGKNRTAQKTYQLMNALFTYAVADGIIDRSPTAKVIVGTYEQEHGTALTRTEEKELVNKFFENPKIRYRQAFVFILYTGLRRSELATADMNEKWITVTTAKQRKGKKEKIRRIPISPMLKELLPFIDLSLIKKTDINKMTWEFKKICEGHHLHDLRHTFITRCQECGIQIEIVSIWAGHSTNKSITSTVYTHLEQYEEKQLSEIEKYRYIL